MATGVGLGRADQPDRNTGTPLSNVISFEAFRNLKKAVKAAPAVRVVQLPEGILSVIADHDGSLKFAYVPGCEQLTFEAPVPNLPGVRYSLIEGLDGDWWLELGPNESYGLPSFEDALNYAQVIADCGMQSLA